MTSPAERLQAEGLEPIQWSNGPGDRYGAHSHSFDKIIIVERGSIDFGLPVEGRSLALEAGDRLELPAGTSHEALVGDAGVECWEAHLPGGRFSAAARRAAGEW